jgi:hypothetical protein
LLPVFVNRSFAAKPPKSLIPNTQIPRPILPIISPPKRTIKYIGPNLGHFLNPGRTTVTIKSDPARPKTPPDPASEARFSLQFDVFPFSSLFRARQTLTSLIATSACIYFFTVVLIFFAFVTTLYGAFGFSLFSPYLSQAM